MQYVSTRGGVEPTGLPQAILTGIAPDGGLFYPEVIPPVTDAERRGFAELSYAELAAEVFCRFSPDFTHADILALAQDAYDPRRYTDPAIAPVRHLQDDVFLLELFHGPTGAFKDFALQLLPRVMRHAAEKLHAGETCILVATSGDTGGAALAGFAEVPGMHLVTFFPRGGVSPLQQAQMQCARGNNLSVVEIEGDFDGAQKSVKELFLDRDFAAELQQQRNIRLSSANSINIGRLLPQIIYAFAAHAQLVQQGAIDFAEPLDLVVPSGNMGDIFAGYLAKQMGLPVGRLLVANNSNDSAAQFIRTGTFDVRGRQTAKTASPAMDILKASNLERLLFEASGRDAEQVREWQEALATTGCFRADAETHARIAAEFCGETVDDATTAQAIAQTLERTGYLLDPHTAVGLAALEQSPGLQASPNKKLLFATAHFAKFGQTVFRALFPQAALPPTETQVLQHIATRASTPAIPQHFFDILAAAPCHERVCADNTPAMRATVRDCLG